MERGRLVSFTRKNSHFRNLLTVFWEKVFSCQPNFGHLSITDELVGVGKKYNFVSIWSIAVKVYQQTGLGKIFEFKGEKMVRPGIYDVIYHPYNF